MKFINKKNSLNKFKDPTKYSNWLTKMLKNKEIIKVRNDLYYLVNKKVDKYQIASWINEDSFICYHSALEYYGLANQVFTEVYVGGSFKFNSFWHNGIHYSHVDKKSNEYVEHLEKHDVNVTSIEMTLIDCIDNILLGGGIDEVISALSDNTPEKINIDFKKCLKILKFKNKIFLYQKVGFLFEYFSQSLGTPDWFILECLNHLTKKVNYLTKSYIKTNVFNPKWNLMVPSNISAILNGGVDDINEITI